MDSDPTSTELVARGMRRPAWLGPVVATERVVTGPLGFGGRKDSPADEDFPDFILVCALVKLPVR